MSIPLQQVKKRLGWFLELYFNNLYRYVRVKKTIENRTLIANKIAELNEESYNRSGARTIIAPPPIPQIWSAVGGYFVVTGFDFAQGKNIFNPSHGYPTKVFLNGLTGEVKMYSANMFER